MCLPRDNHVIGDFASPLFKPSGSGEMPTGELTNHIFLTVNDNMWYC